MPRQKPGLSEQVVGTPWGLIFKTHELLDIQEFDCDLATIRHNRKAPRWIAPPDYVAPWNDQPVARDAFLHSWKWGHGWNWLNPPFDKIKPWVERAWQEEAINHARTCVLVPASTGSNWWRDFVHDKARVMLLNGRLTFEGHDKPYPKDCALLLYGYSPSHGYDVWDWKRGKQGVISWQ